MHSIYKSFCAAFLEKLPKPLKSSSFLKKAAQKTLTMGQARAFLAQKLQIRSKLYLFPYTNPYSKVFAELFRESSSVSYSKASVQAAEGHCLKDVLLRYVLAAREIRYRARDAQQSVIPASRQPEAVVCTA